VLWWCCLAAAVVGLVYHAVLFDFLNDDAFISFRYADNLVEHGELVFNPGTGERVEGYTNFLWTILMAVVLWCGEDPALWSRILGVACASTTLIIVTAFITRLRNGRALSDILSAALLASAPAYACWSMGGLETQLFTLLATLGWTRYLLARVDAPTDVWKSGLWFALAAMTRPEGILMIGLVVIHHLVEMCILEKRIRPTSSEWIWAAVFLGIFCPYFAWRWSYYGWPFPNTYYVKSGAPNFWTPGFAYFRNWVTDNGIWMVPILAVLGTRRLGTSGRRLLTLGTLLSVVLSLHVMKVGGDFMALHRFLVPIMPILAVMAALGLAEIHRLVSPDYPMRYWAAVGVTCLLAFGHIKAIQDHALSVGSDDGVDRIGWLKQFHEQCTEIGKHLRDTADPEASMAITAAGIIPYYSRLYTVDILALNDEYVAHNAEPKGNRPGHTKQASREYIMSKEVDYLIYHPHISSKKPRRRGSPRGYRWVSVELDGMTPPWWSYHRRIHPKTGQ